MKLFKELKKALGYYKWWVFKSVRSPGQFLLFFINPLRVENEIRAKRNLLPYWKKVPSDEIVKHPNSYALFIRGQKEPIVLIKDIMPYTTSYLDKLVDLYLVRYYDKRKKLFMEISEHSEFFGTHYSGDTHIVHRPEEIYKEDYDKQIKMIRSCIKVLEKYAYLFWRYSLLKRYIQILKDKEDEIKFKKKRLLESV